MATQHEIARPLFQLVADAASKGTWLTYKDAAIALGYTADYSRAVAQACDLLDAAAAWAGVPLLALSYVRSADGGYNPKAFDHAEQREYREAIFNRSISYKFTRKDFDAIYAALVGEFARDSNISSWKRIISKFDDAKDLWARLASGHTVEADALNDLGSDLPDTRISTSISFVRDEKVRRAVLRRADGNCEYCGAPGFKLLGGGVYLECHHIIRLADEGADKVSNVIALCANDHREAHFGIHRDAVEKEMIAIVGKKIAKKKVKGAR